MIFSHPDPTTYYEVFLDTLKPESHSFFFLYFPLKAYNVLWPCLSCSLWLPFYGSNDDDDDGLQVTVLLHIANVWSAIDPETHPERCYAAFVAVHVDDKRSKKG